MFYLGEIIFKFFVLPFYSGPKILILAWLVSDPLKAACTRIEKPP